MTQLLPQAEWPRLLAEARVITPEAFTEAGQPLNLAEGQWGQPGRRKPFLSPVDGTLLGSYPMLELEAAKRAVRFAADESEAWAAVPLPERCRRVADCLSALRRSRDLLSYLLVWEIGKPVRLARVDVDRCLDGVQWYLSQIQSMVEGRRPVGLVSNIASWNYPFSVLMHAVLVQCLAGNAVISKAPSDGGLFSLTVGHALARQCGLPVSLVSGSGGQLSEALVRNDAVDCLAFVGGKTNGRDIAASLYDREKRYMLEMEGVNAYGVWNFSDWGSLAGQLKKGFEYGKQRCTAYVRYVVQRSLFPQFLEAYLPVLRTLRFGHPLLVSQPGDEPPEVDFGPLINPAKAEELSVMVSEAIGLGATPVYRGSLDPARFLPEQDTSAYFAPVALLGVPRNCRLYHREPFGPVDTILVVDSLEEMITEMNVSNGALVASLATDDVATEKAVAGELRAFKVGVNQMRSRGDRDEAFGGIGQSWKGCFVGGKYLIEAVTHGPPGERACGNFPDYTLLPEPR
ncbi:MAG: aldehyde dehydrogenase family protein [Gemmataceae bacterium]